MKPITLARLTLSLLAFNAALTQAADFEVRNEAEFKKIFPADAKVTKLADAVRDDRDDAGGELEVEERRGMYKQADIYKMHTYRDALPSARSVWILYPGSEFRFFDVEQGRVDRASELGATPDGVGAVGLNPGVEGELGAVIRRLTHSSAIPSS